MTEVILESRLDALEGDLDRVDRSLMLVQQLQLNLRVPTDLSTRVHTAAQAEITTARNKLKAARGQLAGGNAHGGDRDAALRSAWEEFADIQQTTRALFSSCLEFLGGLAFREDRVRRGAEPPEEEVWEVADMLVAESVNAMWGFTQPFLTVPALGETFCDSVVSTVRLRFPEWSVWSLPLGAYEFGHIAIVERPLDEFFRDLLGSRVQGAEVPADIRRGRWRFPRTSPEHRLRVLLADAFAALHSGLAYGAAALHLRFDPVSAHAGTPTYDERAIVVIAALRTLAAEYGLDADLMNTRIDQLEGEWSDAVKCASPGAVTPGGDQVPIDELVPSLVSGLRESLASSVVYGQERWAFGRTIAGSWMAAHPHRKPFDTTLQPGYTLRDMLNAAWLCRLVDPDIADRAGDAAMKMAMQYLETDAATPGAATQGSSFDRSAVGRFGGGRT